MKVESLLVSAFLVGRTNVECFTPPPASLSSTARHSRIARGHPTRPSPDHDHNSITTSTSSNKASTSRSSPRQSSRPNRKRARTCAPLLSTKTDEAAGTTGPELNSNTQLPPRLQEMVDRLDQKPDLCSKSKLLVQIGDAFSLTDAYTDSSTGTGVCPPLGDCALKKVPGCVSEVHVAVDVDYPAPSTPPGGELEVDDVAVVTVRGTADARVSRGILALLARGLKGESPATVLGLRSESVAAAVGIRAGLTGSRINGLGNILYVIQREVRDHLKRSPTTTEEVNSSGHDASGDDWVNEASFSADSLNTVELVSPSVVADVAGTRSTIEAEGEADLLQRPSGNDIEVKDRIREGVVADKGQMKEKEKDASRWTPLPGAEDEVAVLLSGGVDSSVALRLLRDEGYRVRAFYLKIWLEDELAHLGECPWEEDLAYATAVCDQVGVPLEVVPLQREYWEHVVAYTVREARDGRTPNPDIMCNTRIKFGMFYDHVGKHFKHVATGHYARLRRDEDAENQGRVRLLLSPDAVKDQTYFLCALTQAQLQKALFPVGAYTKESIRELAVTYDLPTKNRKDSQGICFLGKLKFEDFLRHYLGESPGPVIDRATGERIGEHRGLWFHTIGQRKGIGPVLNVGMVHKGPWFVSGKDMTSNVLEVTNDFEAIDGPRESFQVEALRWIEGHPPAELEEQGTMRMMVKTRHGPQMKNCVLRLIAQHADGAAGQPPPPLPIPHSRLGHALAHDGKRREEFEPTVQVDGKLMPRAFLAVNTCAAQSLPQRGYVQLGIKDSGLAPGQFAAFYLGEECVGSGVISDCSATAASSGTAAAKCASGYAALTSSNRGGGQEKVEQGETVG